MVSAGLDTVPGNLIMGLAYLSSPHGQEIQKRAYADIMSVYPNGDAWSRCLTEEKVPYVTALYKEVLRFFSVIPICLPRTSLKDIEWQGAVIPSGTTFFMNAWAANYDASHFRDAEHFRPERYLDGAEKAEGTSHYAVSPSFPNRQHPPSPPSPPSPSLQQQQQPKTNPSQKYGAGSRMCAGSHLANRELYTALLRIILAFQIVEAQDPAERPILNALDCNAIPTSLTTEPKPFKVGFRIRDEGRLEEWIRESEEATAGL